MHHNNENRTVESNQVKLLQEQNIELAKQLQEIKFKINKLEKYKEITQVNIKEKDNNHQTVESNMVSFTILVFFTFYFYQFMKFTGRRNDEEIAKREW